MLPADLGGLGGQGWVLHREMLNLTRDTLYKEHNVNTTTRSDVCGDPTDASGPPSKHKSLASSGVLWNGDRSLARCTQVILQLPAQITTILLSPPFCSHAVVTTSVLFSGFWVFLKRQKKKKKKESGMAREAHTLSCLLLFLLPSPRSHFLFLFFLTLLLHPFS